MSIIERHGLLLLGLIVAFVALVYAKNRISTLETENDALKTVISTKIVVKKAENGAEMAKVPVAEVGQQTLNELTEQIRDSLKKDFGGPINRVLQYQEVSLNTVNSLIMGGKEVKVPTMGGDSTVVKVFRHSDAWMDRVDTLIGDSLHSTTKVRNDLKIIIRKDKRAKWYQIFRKRKMVAQVYSGNPDTKIEGVQILKVIDK